MRALHFELLKAEGEREIQSSSGYIQGNSVERRGNEAHLKREEIYLRAMVVKLESLHIRERYTDVRYELL